VSAIALRQHGIGVLLIEKRSYPLHRVCGEYVSNEVRGYLENLDIFPHALNPNEITRLQLSSVNGRSAFLGLDTGGFGISRYAFDRFLYEKAMAAGVEFLLGSAVGDVRFESDRFTVVTDTNAYLETEVVVGAFGKRSKLDKALDRSFFKKRSPYIGVKYHIEYDAHPPDTIALHNFDNGYCGINAIEDGKCNLCYLSARSNLQESRDIPEMEARILCRNPELERIFSGARFLFEKPEVISEISFETKSPVEQHILMCGDAAGMIAPLCGNGMAMAIHSAKIASGAVRAYFMEHHSRQQMEHQYARQWRALFGTRLTVGRQIQKLFGSRTFSDVSVEIARKSKPIAAFLVGLTHGKPF